MALLQVGKFSKVPKTFPVNSSHTILPLPFLFPSRTPVPPDVHLMSNTPFTPENAAAAAVVSPGRPAGDAASSASSGAPPPGTSSTSTNSSNPSSSNSTAPDPPPPTLEQDAPPSPVPPQPPAPSAQPGTPAPSPVTSSHADPFKYARGFLQRSNGPSLLTQALATARGIPRQHQNLPTSAQGSAEPQEAPSRQNDGSLLAPRFSPRKTTATTMASSTTMCTTAAPPALARLDLGEVNSMLNGHREFLVRARDRAPPESTEWEPRDRGRDRPNRSTHETAASSALSSPLFVDSPTRLHAEPADDHAVPDARPPPRTWKTEHRLSKAPEKAWSIGSGDVANGQDGQVEKSITEVLAGVEPNARSRKASHSLRFFKEGLPEEKGKRKDSRVALPAREKSPARGEKLADIDEQPTPAESAKTPAPADEREGPFRSRTLPVRTPEARAIRESPEDYFLAKHGDRLIRDAATKQDLPGHEASHPKDQVPESAGSSCAHSDPRQVLDAGAEAGESGEEGEESSEEKISSAVFLPHQTPEQSEEQSPVPGVPQRAVLSRKHSRHDDFHPWLVKADEPEGDNRENIDYEGRIRSEAAEPPSVAPEVAFRQVEESAVPDERVPASLASRPSRPVSQYYEETAHDHQWSPKQPLEAIELIPYKHQVGGHTTLWRFSRRAVCKQLNNRENEFYEKVEKYHRDLLAFLPRYVSTTLSPCFVLWRKLTMGPSRYIGVLNVTFQKQPRRKSTMRRDDNAAQANARANGTTQDDAAQKSLEAHASDAPSRVVSQSIQSSSGQIPTVTFVDNQHILPRNLLQPTASLPNYAGRYRSASACLRGAGPCTQDGAGADGRENGSRPSLQDRHANSWGATTVNKRLRNEVFNDAFLKQPIAIHRHRKGHQGRPVPRRALQQVLRPSGSDPTLIESHEKRAQAAAAHASQQPIQNGSSLSLSQTQSDLGRTHEYSVGDDENAPKDVTGTSAPEPEILKDSSPAQKKKRRYSGTGLRRKPKDVRDDRGDLKYFEEADDAGYKGDREDATTPNESHMTSPPSREEPAPEIANGTAGGRQAASAAGPLAHPGPGPEFGKIPRPVNPKEAQTQRDSRVEYFLLLEDLTAGMKRPCIMDLKMGTRQYGVDANPKKQKSQQGKCAQTTSRELGVRLCGLQVWDVRTQSYVFKDKYYGRELKKGAEFQAALTRFLYDGADPASILRHIPTVLQKLDELEVIIERLRGYRFYAASLLMFYDGDDSADDSGNGSSNNVSNNNGTMMVEDSTTDFATDTEEAAAGQPLGRRTRRSRREIDFKMADFANCVTAGDLSSRDRPCPPRHPDEPDRGFLRGLRSLRRYFLRIQRDTRAEMGLGVVTAQRNNGGGANGREMDLDEEEEGSVSE